MVGHLVKAGVAYDYDGTAAVACVEAIRAVDCKRSALMRFPPVACKGTFKGALTAGATCHLDEECVSGRCADLSCSDASCCLGVCAPAQTIPNPIPVGGDCTAGTATCIDGNECRRSSAGWTCTAAPGLWQDCDPAGLSITRCLDGAACRPSTSALGGTCMPPPARGQACDESRNPCDATDDYCDPVTSTCVARIAVGMPCPEDTGCLQYARCDSVAGVCLPLKNAGQACEQTSPDPVCLVALECMYARDEVPEAYVARWPDEGSEAW